MTGSSNTSSTGMHKDYIDCWLLGICVALSFFIAFVGLGFCIFRIVEHFLK